MAKPVIWEVDDLLDDWQSSYHPVFEGNAGAQRLAMVVEKIDRLLECPALQPLCQLDILAAERIRVQAKRLAAAFASTNRRRSRLSSSSPRFPW